MTNAIADEFERALAALCTEERQRAIEGGASGAADELWAQIDALGFSDALVDEAHGGAGLSLDEAAPLLIAAGEAGMCHPFGETMMVRALLARAGCRVESGALALAQGVLDKDGALVCANVPGAQIASHVLVGAGDSWLLMPRESAEATPGAYRPQVSASLRWRSAQAAVARFARGAERAETIANAVHAAQMAGTMRRVMALSVGYANDRTQFGRPIGRFQAVQQELAVLAAQAASATTAARIGCATAEPFPEPLRAALAKLRASEAAQKVCTVGHAVHGAIGITEEHPLRLYTNRLHEWRAAPGTATRCAVELGDALIAAETCTFAEFLRGPLALGVAAPI
ncbi:acyl-CoA dehydrogenase [Caballeronia novacaledonica]|uniref:Acyl-CoA dehydrogenase n=1 Tax=Caballeronia novacaledonica TaxID=1544861 RepID=A0A2U3I3C7_9BURK|nr:acyl-CoA dehydrogenase family protein [Caballeronia novacaledonica]SPB14601.1 acyl-CoA dehydrogenase [Caballeronia novacaledonica]